MMIIIMMLIVTLIEIVVVIVIVIVLVGDDRARWLSISLMFPLRNRKMLGSIKFDPRASLRRNANIISSPPLY